MSKAKQSSLLDHLFIVSSLAVESSDLSDMSNEGFLIRTLNWDPIRLRSSWKRLSNINRKYTVAMGTKVDVELLDEWDQYTMDLVTRGNKIVHDLSKEVLFDIAIILESEAILTDNVVKLQAAIQEGQDLRIYANTPLPLFDRPLLGARSIGGSENELDLIKQGLKVKTNTRVGHSYHYGGGGGVTVEQTPDRKADVRNLRKAGTYWDNRKTNDVVKALRLLETTVARESLISKSMVGATGKDGKALVKELMVWQEILYEHAYFIVHRTSKLLAGVM